MTLNQKHVDELRDILGAEFSTLVATFLTDSKPRLEKALAALEQGEFELARKELHTLKGSSANLGSIEFSARCQQVEALLKAGERPAPCREALLDSYEALERALRRLLS